MDFKDFTDFLTSFSILPIKHLHQQRTGNENGRIRAQKDAD